MRASRKISADRSRIHTYVIRSNLRQYAGKTYDDTLDAESGQAVETLADQNSFGMLIKKWEDERPIPEPDEAWRDVDGIRRYINVWFLGHLCKMMGIKNSCSQAYEDEIARFRVERPAYEEDELEDDTLDSMFEGGG